MFKTVLRKGLDTKERSTIIIISLICIKNNLKIDVMVLAKCLTEHFGAAIINLDPVGCLCSFIRSVHTCEFFMIIRKVQFSFSGKKFGYF